MDSSPYFNESETFNVYTLQEERSSIVEKYYPRLYEILLLFNFRERKIKMSSICLEDKLK